MIYQGFLDSEYNTDNSWQEATVVSYHDANDNAFPSVTFPETSPYRWDIALQAGQYSQIIFILQLHFKTVDFLIN